jgi:hypothetical protein
VADDAASSWDESANRRSEIAAGAGGVAAGATPPTASTMATAGATRIATRCEVMTLLARFRFATPTWPTTPAFCQARDRSRIGYRASRNGSTAPSNAVDSKML